MAMRPQPEAMVNRVYLIMAIIAFCFGTVSEASAAMISQTTAATVCNNHGGLQIYTNGNSGCSWCTTKGKKQCTTIYCWRSTCGISIQAKAPPEGGKPTNAAPITTTKPVQEK